MASKGTFATLGSKEFIAYGSDIYEGDASNPLDNDGYRMGARWLCSENAWCLYQRIVESDGGQLQFLAVQFKP